MRRYYIANTDVDTQAELDKFAEAMVYGKVTLPTPTTILIETEFVSGNEDQTKLIYDDEGQEIVLAGMRLTDSQYGNVVVGFASLSDIKKECRNYEIYPQFVDASGDPLFRGMLKVSKTEVYTPDVTSGTHVQFIPREF